MAEQWERDQRWAGIKRASVSFLTMVSSLAFWRKWDKR